MIGVARPGPRPQPQRLALCPGLGVRPRDQLAGGQVERVPAVPGERGEVTGVARQHRRVPLLGREAVPSAERADRRYLGRLGQRPEQRVAQRPRQQPGQCGQPRDAGAPGPGRPGELGHAPAADRLDQRPDERQRSGLDVFRPSQVVGQHVQLPEGHHQAAAAQPHRLKPRVRRPQPSLIRLPRRPPELLEQPAIAGHRRRVPVRRRLHQRRIEVPEHRVLPGHVPLQHRPPAPAAATAAAPETAPPNVVERPARSASAAASAARSSAVPRSGRCELTRPRDCCTTCATSCASSHSPSRVSGRNAPAAKQMSVPTVNARAPTAWHARSA